jgi:hypothetical protein
MEFLIVMMDLMNLDVLQSNLINVIKRNTSVVRRLEFVFHLLGIVMAQMIAMIILMNKNVDQFHVQITSTNVETQNASSKLMFVMEKMIVAIILMNHMNTHVFHHHFVVQLANGNVLELLIVVLISLQFVTMLPTVQMVLMKVKDVILLNVNIKMDNVLMDVKKLHRVLFAFVLLVKN